MDPFTIEDMPAITEGDEDFHTDYHGVQYPFKSLLPGKAYVVPYSLRRLNYFRTRVVWASIRYGRRFRWKWRKPETEIIIWCEAK
jgi:hypothetical protein